MLSKLRQRLIKFVRLNQGSVTIEFALTIIIFLAILGAFLELARLCLLSAYLDSAVALTTRAAKNNPEYTGQNYAQLVTEYLENEHKGWEWLDNGTITVDADYYMDIDSFITGNKSNTSLSQPLAEYKVNYTYNPMFSYFPKDLVGTMMSRKILVLQEHERKESDQP